MSVRHPIFARVYDRMSRKMEPEGPGVHRARMLAGVRGRVVEVGAGNGLNFAHYPSTVDEVIAVEPEPYLRAAAARSAAAAPVPVTVVEGTADHLPVEDASCDAVVSSLVLCSVPDQAVAIAEMRRVLKPGGELRFYEHVRATDPRQARIQRGIDRVWPHCFGGCHTGRDTVSAITAGGFALQTVDRFRFPDGRFFVPPEPHALGVALPAPTGHDGGR